DTHVPEAAAALPTGDDAAARARRNVYVSLQLDALRNPELRVLRGAGDHAAVKARALANLERAGVRTTIVSTVAKGVNDSQIGECVNLLFERDFILSLTFQPASYTGYGGTAYAPPLSAQTPPHPTHSPGAAA